MKEQTINQEPPVMLGDIADIQSGFLFRFRVENRKDGNVRVVQLKDMDDAGRLNLAGSANVKMDAVKEKYYLKEGDILFKSKSNRNTAGVVGGDIGAAVPTVHYLVIRTKTPSVLPAYLAWYLNQKPAQNYFDAVAESTHLVRLIKIKEIGKLKVPIPSLEIQRKVTAAAGLFARETAVTRQLLEKRKAFIEAALLQIVAKQPDTQRGDNS